MNVLINTISIKEKSIKNCYIENVGKVSTIFEFFLSGFVSASETTLVQVELGAEFDSESNGDILRPGCP
jgi:hypothetical protein